MKSVATDVPEHAVRSSVSLCSSSVGSVSTMSATAVPLFVYVSCGQKGAGGGPGGSGGEGGHGGGVGGRGAGVAHSVSAA